LNNFPEARSNIALQNGKMHPHSSLYNKRWSKEHHLTTGIQKLMNQNELCINRLKQGQKVGLGSVLQTSMKIISK